MTDDDLLDLLELSLYTEARVTSKNSKYEVGTTPEKTPASIDDLNEVDICYAERLRIKAFYSNTTKSNNSSAFYLEIDDDTLDMWIKAAKLFYNKKRPTVSLDKLQKLRTRVLKNSQEKEKNIQSWERE